jgi:hypothetical protein
MRRGRVARGIVLAHLVAVELGAARQSRIRAEAEGKRAEEQAKRAQRNALGIKEEGPQFEIEIRKDGTRALVEQFDPIKALESLSAQILPDSVTFDFVFRDDGELTIRAPLIEFRQVSNGRLFDEGLVRVLKSVPTRLKLEDAIVYPGDEQTINNSAFSLECKREVALAAGDHVLHWKVFLDNSPPSAGEIDLASLIESARKQGVANR